MKNSKFFLLIISLIFFVNLAFFNFSYATLYVVKDQEGNSVCITNQESLISKYKLLGYIISIVQGSGSVKESSEPQPKSEPESIESQPIPEFKSENEASNLNVKIIDSTNYRSKSGNYIYVEGIIKNKGNIIVKNLEIMIRALDKYDKLVSLTNGIPFPSTLAPNQEATYQVMVDYNSKIVSFEMSIYGN